MAQSERRVRAKREYDKSLESGGVDYKEIALVEQLPGEENKCSHSKICSCRPDGAPKISKTPSLFFASSKPEPVDYSTLLKLVKTVALAV